MNDFKVVNSISQMSNFGKVRAIIGENVDLELCHDFASDTNSIEKISTSKNYSQKGYVFISL